MAEPPSAAALPFYVRRKHGIMCPITGFLAASIWDELNLGWDHLLDTRSLTARRGCHMSHFKQWSPLSCVYVA